MELIINAQLLMFVGVNKKYYISRGKLILSNEYRDFKKHLMYLCVGRKVFGKNIIRVLIEVSHKMRHDIDAIIKPVLDAMQDARVYDNDKQIAQLIVKKVNDLDKGDLRVWVGNYDG